MDIEFQERVKGKNYRCNDCGERFQSVSKRPICPSCGSDNVSPE
jgi:Zn finger protein HypA/HybF involved in hydrogenase expression